MINRRAYIGVGVLAAAGFAVFLFGPNACSSKRARLDTGPTAAAPTATVLPTASFAHAATGTGKGVTVADIAERSLPAVVNISSEKVVTRKRSPMFNDPFFRRFFGGRVPGLPHKRRARSLGSGVIVDREGTVLTNHHVVKNADEIQVTLSDRREFSAKVVGGDAKSDIAVLRLEGKVGDLEPIAFGDSNKLRLGDLVIAIGNPFGVGQTVTMGIVSAKGRANVGIVDYENFIQTDAAINPGNSGGALIDMSGRLVGINTAILSRTGGNQGIGFAIPSAMARPIMNSLIEHGKVVRGWLGVTIQDLNADLARALGVPPARGVLVADVMPGSPAEEAGIKRGDVLLAVNGRKVNTTGHLRNAVAAAGKGKQVKITLLRKGKRHTLRVKLGEMPDNLRAARPSVAPRARRGSLAGLSVVPLTRELRTKLGIPARVSHGVVVKAVERGSVAARAGVRPGDVIIEVGRRPVKSVPEFVKAFRAAKDRVLLLAYRKGSTLYLLVPKGEEE